MSWNIADYYLLDKIKKQQAQIDFLLYRIGNVTQIIATGGGGIHSGTGDPNIAGLVPSPANKPAVYQEYVNGVPVTLWWWSVADQAWI